MRREEFNPLSATREESQEFGYSTTYNIGQTNTTWINSAGYNLVRGPLFLRNTTQVNMDRFDVGARTATAADAQTRRPSWAGSCRTSCHSVVARFSIAFDTNDPGSLANEGETKNEFQLSTRTRQRPMRGLTSEINAFAGILDLTNSTQVKRGLSGDVNGRLRYVRGWLTHDLTALFNGNIARTRLPSADERLNTNDFSQNVRGTLGMFQNGPIGANLNYSYRNVRVETPLDSGRIQQVNTKNASVDLTTRLRQTSNRYINLGGRFSTNQQLNTANPASQSKRADLLVNSDGRITLLGWLVEPRLSVQWSRSEFPQRSNAGGYGESLRVSTFNISMQKSLTPKILGRATADVSLSQFRYFTLGGEPPVPRDQYRQNYRLEGTYTYSENFNTGLILDVGRVNFINIPSSSTGANNEVSTYIGEWRWSFRLLPGLTAIQVNQIVADYTRFTFLPENNRVALDYTSRTTLSAVLSPRISVDVTHNARYQPSGDYLRQADGNEYFSPADETENFVLGANINYAPTPAFSITLSPVYTATDRAQTLDGEVVPTRESRVLDFTGGANVNLPIGSRGRLTGNLRRTFRGDRTTTFSGGVPIPSPAGEIDYWNGSLNFTWDL